VLEDRLTPSTGGMLDPTFGSGGVVTTSFTNGTDQPYVVVAQADGKLVVAGDTLVAGHGFWAPSHDYMQVARYNTNGTLDATFGAGGHVTTDFFGKGAVANAVALQSQPDGTSKILAAGAAFRSSTTGDFAVVRYNANGTLDAAFGTGGKVTTDLGSNNEEVTSMAVQPDGKILVAGYTTQATGQMAALVRYNANGSLDTSFGSGGKLITGIQVQNVGVALQSQLDGSFKVVIAGQTQTVGSTPYFSLFAARFNANGTPDAGFGTGGEVTTLAGFGDVFGGLAVQADGKVVVSGIEGNRIPGKPVDLEALVVRYTANGAPDASFGPAGNGIAAVPRPAGYTVFRDGAVAIQADGQIVVGGMLGSVVGYSTKYVFAMTRLNGDHSPNGPAGTVDTGYGTAGWATALAEYSDTPAGTLQTIALEPDGRAVIVAGANRYPQWQMDFAVVRFLASAPQIGAFTASPNAVMAGGSTTLTASNITDGNPNSTITQVTFYTINSSGAKVVLGYGLLTSPGVWTLNLTVNLASGNYTLYAQAQDSDGVFGDPLATTLQVM
jgi:uncharacterized delta-60 repeat protein